MKPSTRRFLSMVVVTLVALALLWVANHYFGDLGVIIIIGFLMVLAVFYVFVEPRRILKRMQVILQEMQEMLPPK